MDRFGIVVDRSQQAPLHRQLAAAFREAIVRGVLLPGERILSSRELQTHLGLSRNTVVNALAQLQAEGYLETERGVGTFVASQVHQLPSESHGQPAGEGVAPSWAADQFIGALPLAADLPGHTAFRPGLPALEHFPARLFRRALSATNWTPALLDYGEGLGHAPLRAAIARRLQQTRGVVCSPDRIIITDGGQSAFSLIARVLLNRNDAAIMEDPGYPNFRAILLALGTRIFNAPVDDEGLTVSSFRKRRAKLVYVTPSHQYPTGAVLSLERRFALIDWAIKNDAWIIEDDYDSEFTYTERPLPALQGLGGGAHVIYVGTFSKVLSPALRVAYIVVPPALQGAFAAARQVMSGQTSMLIQSALAEFMESGHLGRHIARMRKVYDERRRFTSSALSSASDAFKVRDTRAGLHFIVEVPGSIDDLAFAARAQQAGVTTPPLARYFHGVKTRNGFVVGFAATPPQAAKKSVDTLRSLI